MYERDPEHVIAQRLTDHLPLQQGLLVEVGCGTGLVTCQLVEAGARVLALEPHGPSLHESRLTVGAPHVVHVVQASGTALPLASGCARVVLFSLSLHHTPDPVRALAEATRVVHPRGHIAVLEPTPQGQVQRVCRVFEDEDRVLDATENLLASHSPPRLHTQTFHTVHRFDDFGHMHAHWAAYYGQQPTAHSHKALLRAVQQTGADAAASPLVLTDTLRLSLLAS